MKKIALVLYFFFLCQLINAQKVDTSYAYYDNDWKVCDSKKATYYRKYYQVSNLWHVTDYYKSNNRIQMSGSYVDSNFEYHQGEFKYFYENGSPSLFINYIDNKKEGIVKEWNKNGILKSAVTYQDGIWVKSECFKDNGDACPICKCNNPPSFPGGQQALINYLNTNLSYPHMARINGIQGRVVLTFTVDPEGQISKINIESTASPYLNESAMDLIRNMPKWTPGYLDDKPIYSRVTLPIRYKLD